MEASDELWQGFKINVKRELFAVHTFYVEFWPNQPMASKGHDGEPPEVPSSANVPVPITAKVTVEGEQVFRVTDFRPPEIPLPHLFPEDYERRALEAVREYVSRGS